MFILDTYREFITTNVSTAVVFNGKCSLCSYDISCCLSDEWKSTFNHLLLTKVIMIFSHTWEKFTWKWSWTFSISTPINLAFTSKSPTSSVGEISNMTFLNLREERGNNMRQKVTTQHKKPTIIILQFIDLTNKMIVVVSISTELWGTVSRTQICWDGFDLSVCSKSFLIFLHLSPSLFIYNSSTFPP